MKLLAYLYVLIFIQTTSLASATEIHNSRAIFVNEKQSLNDRSLGKWLSDLKSIVNSDMLSPVGEMNRRLIEQGDLSDRDRHLLSYYLEVKPLEGSEKIYLALFYSRLHMNKTLIRSSLYQDGGPGVDKNVVPKGDELFLHESYEAARGLNLRGSKIRAMMDQSIRENRPLLQEEEVFYKVILPKLESLHLNEDFFVIAFNLVGFSIDTLGHEVAHSLLDTNPDYKKVIYDFWAKKVSETDKNKIRSLLSDVYSSEPVIIDEFQAYLLQPKVPAPQSELLAEFVPKYLSSLVKALKDKSLPLPFVQESSCSQKLTIVRK